jgi:AAA domain-containing protein
LDDSPFRLGETWKFKSLSDILDNPPDPIPPWVFHGLVSKGSGTLVSSQPHGMKSYTWLQAAIEGALGMNIWGHFPVSKCQRTLFLETEDPGWMVEQRVTSIANGLGITSADAKDAGCFTLGMLGPFDLIKAGEKMQKVLEKYKPDICVLSTLQGLLGGRNWKEQNEMAPINAMMVHISSAYCPVVVITHSPQDKKQKRAAGTITQSANYPNILHYDKCNVASGTFARVHLDSKMGMSEKFRIRLVNSIPEKIRFVWSKDTDTEALKHYVSEHPDESTTEIAEQFDVSDRYVRKLKISSAVVPQANRNKSRNNQKRFRSYLDDVDL